MLPILYYKDLKGLLSTKKKLIIFLNFGLNFFLYNFSGFSLIFNINKILVQLIYVTNIVDIKFYTHIQNIILFSLFFQFSICEIFKGMSIV